MKRLTGFLLSMILSLAIASGGTVSAYPNGFTWHVKNTTDVAKRYRYQIRTNDGSLVSENWSTIGPNQDVGLSFGSDQFQLSVIEVKDISQDAIPKDPLLRVSYFKQLEEERLAQLARNKAEQDAIKVAMEKAAAKKKADQTADAKREAEQTLETEKKENERQKAEMQELRRRKAEEDAMKAKLVEKEAEKQQLIAEIGALKETVKSKAADIQTKNKSINELKRSQEDFEVVLKQLRSQQVSIDKKLWGSENSIEFIMKDLSLDLDDNPYNNRKSSVQAKEFKVSHDQLKRESASTASSIEEKEKELEKIKGAIVESERKRDEMIQGLIDLVGSENASE